MWKWKKTCLMLHIMCELYVVKCCLEILSYLIKSEIWHLDRVDDFFSLGVSTSI